jgi:hypothetical protein
VQRSKRGAAPLSQSDQFLAAVIRLDMAMKQPIVIGIYQDSMQVDDAHITQACVDVQNALDNIAQSLEKVTHTLLMSGDEITSLN